MHILKLWCNIKNSILSINAYLFERAKFHPDPIWKDKALGFFKEGHPNKNKMSSDVGSVPDPQIHDCQKSQSVLQNSTSACTFLTIMAPSESWLFILKGEVEC